MTIIKSNFYKNLHTTVDTKEIRGLMIKFKSKTNQNKILKIYRHQINLSYYYYYYFSTF